MNDHRYLYRGGKGVVPPAQNHTELTISRLGDGFFEDLSVIVSLCQSMSVNVSLFA